MRYHALVWFAVLVMTAPVVAADTGTEVSRSRSKAGVVRARGHGDWVHTQSENDPHFTNGTAIATDDDSISFSNTSVVQGRDGELLGNTLNITVGPGTGSTSTGHAKSQGYPNGVYIRAKTDPEQAVAVIKASGKSTHAITEATNFSRGRLIVVRLTK